MSRNSLFAKVLSIEGNVIVMFAERIESVPKKKSSNKK